MAAENSSLVVDGRLRKEELRGLEVKDRREAGSNLVHRPDARQVMRFESQVVVNVEALTAKKPAAVWRLHFPYLEVAIAV